MLRIALLVSLLGLETCMVLASEGSPGRRLFTSSTNSPIDTPQASIVIGEALETHLGDSVEPSKNLRVGMVVKLKHSNGKGCVRHEKQNGYVCNQPTGQAFRVVDGRGGLLALIEGPEPYTGGAIPESSKYRVSDVAGSPGMITFMQGGKYCTGSITERVICRATAISAAEKFIVKCISSCLTRHRAFSSVSDAKMMVGDVAKAMNHFASDVEGSSGSTLGEGAAAKAAASPATVAEKLKAFEGMILEIKRRGMTKDLFTALTKSATPSERLKQEALHAKMTKEVLDMKSQLKVMRAKLNNKAPSANKGKKGFPEKASHGTWVGAPRYSEKVKAWYLPSRTNDKVPLFGTIDGTGMKNKRCIGPTTFDRSDAGLISVDKFAITAARGCPTRCRKVDAQKCECGVLSRDGKQALRELADDTSIPSKKCKRWGRGVIPTIIGKRMFVSILQWWAAKANEVFPILGPSQKELPSAKCCQAYSNRLMDKWAEPEVTRLCCVKSRDPCHDTPNNPATKFARRRRTTCSTQQKKAAVAFLAPNYRRRFRCAPPCGLALFTTPKTLGYAAFKPRCEPIMPLLPSEGGDPPPNGGFAAGQVAAAPKSSLGEAIGGRRRRRATASRRRRGGQAHRRRFGGAIGGAIGRMAKAFVKKLARKIGDYAGERMGKAFGGVLQAPVDTFFDKNTKGTMMERLKASMMAILKTPDVPILVRYLLYKQVDSTAFSGGIVGSLTLDCAFAMWFYPLITEGTYAKIEHRSVTRPVTGLKGFIPKEGYEALIQDGPIKIHVHKCPGVHWKDTPVDWSDATSIYHRAQQTDGCTQQGKKVPALCTASFTLDFHYCHEFSSKASCQGPMVRQGIGSQLIRDMTAKNSNAECSPWFVLLDSGFRAGFSSMSAVWTTWYLRNCLYGKDKHIEQCLDGQVQNVADGCGAVRAGGLDESKHDICSKKTVAKAAADARARSATKKP